MPGWRSAASLDLVVLGFGQARLRDVQRLDRRRLARPPVNGAMHRTHAAAAEALEALPLLSSTEE